MQVAAIGLRGFPGVIGGIETQCEQIYTELLGCAPGIVVHVFARSPHVPAGVKEYRGLRIHRLWAPEVKGVEAFVHTLLAILHARFLLGVKIMHIHGIGPGFWSPLAWLLGARVIVTHHAPDYDRPKWGKFARLILKAGEYLTARFAHSIICVSYAVKTHFVTRHPGALPRTSIIPNALRPFDDDPVASGEFIRTLGLTPNGFILAAGRLEKTKRFADLLAARKSLNGSAPCLVIAGAATDTDPHEEQLRREAGPGVIMAGYCDRTQLAALYRNCSLFIHPSGMEGFGLVVLEALSLGAPIALSDIPPHREFGLPESCYFRVGDLNAIGDAMAGTNADSFAVPDRDVILGRYNLHANAMAHARIFQGLDIS